MAKMTDAEIERRAEKADDFVMKLCEPKDMTPSQSFDFIERVIERLNTMLGALAEENPELEK